MSNEIKLPDPPEALRERILAMTLPVVKRRARRKRALMLCAVAGAYAVGVLSARLLQSPPAVAPLAATQTLTAIPAMPAVPQPASNEAITASERAALMAARQSPEQRREALRAEGNRWLDDYGDIARATRCYSRLLDTTPANELNRFDPNETWLLRSLRCARLQENVHAKATT